MVKSNMDMSLGDYDMVQLCLPTMLLSLRENK